jgi:hypothetical protein
VKNKIFRSIYPNQVAHDLGKKKISPFVGRSLVFIYREWQKSKYTISFQNEWFVLGYTKDVWHCISEVFLKKIKFFYLKLICFFYIFILFWCVNIKNNFLKIKKYIILMYFRMKNTLKTNNTLSNTLLYLFYDFFLRYIFLGKFPWSWWFFFTSKLKTGVQKTNPNQQMKKKLLVWGGS